MSARSVALKEWRDLLAAGQQLVCGICKFPIAPTEDGPLGPLTADHIIPTVKGGGNARSNLQPAHQRCNSFKGDKLPDEYVITKRHQMYIDAIAGVTGEIAMTTPIKFHTEVLADDVASYPDMRLRLLIRRAWIDATAGPGAITIDEALAILEDEATYLQSQINGAKVAA